MAITTQGYDGVAHEIDEVGWAQISDSYGSTYSVAGLDGAPDENAGRVTTVSSAERTVAVSPLIAYGHGVRDRSDSTVNVQLPAVTVGLARWFFVAVRRDWQTNTTTISALPDAQVARVIPTQRLVNPGVQDDQPLALVQITGGQSIPTAVVDLRCWSGNGGVTAATVDALAYLGRLGSRVTVGDLTYTRILGSTGTPEWITSTADITYGGNFVAQLNVSGGGTLTFPVPFPTECTSVIVQSADGSSSLLPVVAMINAQKSRTGAGFVVRNHNGDVLTGLRRFYYSATGK